MDTRSAQQEMRHAWYAGAPGVFVSGIVWSTAALVTTFVGLREGIMTLLVGGMLIHPLGIVVVRALGRPAKQSAGNPFARLAMESTVLMLFGITLALAVATFHPAWFFPAMLLVIGGRYLVFATIYGLRRYWALGGALACAGVILALGDAPAGTSASIGALVEIGFAVALVPEGRRAAA